MGTLTKAQTLSELNEILVELHRYEQAFQQQKIVFFKPNPRGQQHEFFESQLAHVRLVL